MIEKKVMKCVAVLCLVLALCQLQAIAQSSAGSSTGTPAAASGNTGTLPHSANKAASNTSNANGQPSAADIAAAKSSGKVWVNTESGVYHKSGRWYGKTKTGKFMTETEAKAAGFKEAKRQ